MLVCLYGEMRDALWPEHGLSGSVARCTPAVAFLPARYSFDDARLQNVANPRWVSDAAEPVAAGVIRIGRAGRAPRREIQMAGAAADI